jgi:hypothetical protein
MIDSGRRGVGENGPVSKVFFFTAVDPRARDHYRRTIERAVPLEEIGEDEPDLAAELAGTGLKAVRCWGSVPGDGNRRSWGRMRPGHRALLYLGDASFPLLLQVTHKARSQALAERLWGRDTDDRTWELMFFFGASRQVDLDIGRVREAFGYEDDWWPQGLQYPAPERQSTLLEKFGSVEAFASTLGQGPDGLPAASEKVDLDKLLLGGPFKGAPSKPPRARRSGPPSDPDVSGRGHLAHEQTVALLEAHIGPSFRKGTRGVNHDGVWKLDGHFHIAEVKSVTPLNEVEQLQKGLGQVLYNCFKAAWNGAEVVGYLIAEREPSSSSLWLELCARHDIVFTWPERFEADVPQPR